MYRIIKDGVSIGMTEAPNYIKKAANGCFNLCPEPEASGIVFEGNPYHLLGRDGMDELETVALQEVDSGLEMMAQNESLEYADAMNVDQEYRLTLLELGIIPGETE